MDRNKLHFRKNCEGYFFKDGNVLAKDTGSYIEFPGGGIDEGETPEEALIREVFEETGAVITDLKKVKVIHFIWSDRWAVTEKQKMRYLKFKGEEMHLFTGEIIEFKETNHEEKWLGNLWVPIKEAIDKIEAGVHSDEIKE